MELGQPKAKWTIQESSILYYTEQRKYTEALEILQRICYPLEPRLLCAKARCLIGTGNPTQALELLISAEKKGWDLPEILKLKGRALYQMNEFDTAKLAFEKCDRIQPSMETKRWIQRCIVCIATSDELSRRIIRYETKISSPIVNTVKHEFYQSLTHITLVIYAKDISESQIKVKYSPKNVDVLIDTIPQINIHSNLFKEINTKQCSIHTDSKKIEIKMAKATKGNWSSIEQL
ncbi:CS domain containing protein [Histomonas meleagridis]|uniref:CS domain containing protein n=1 Tax=Histomonas meleagridis TaxID=135588 RepID=UPI003559646B|nr:CS domain containing protein [Histomonas meleagridis]KAH0800085.1 CS domain containing protein [Histomonas meleagridis]